MWATVFSQEPGVLGWVESESKADKFSLRFFHFICFRQDPTCEHGLGECHYSFLDSGAKNGNSFVHEQN